MLWLRRTRSLTCAASAGASGSADAVQVCNCVRGELVLDDVVDLIAYAGVVVRRRERTASCERSSRAGGTNNNELNRL